MLSPVEQWTPLTQKSSEEELAKGAHTSSSLGYNIIASALAFWLLAYYFLRGTIFSRIAFGSQVGELAQIMPAYALSLFAVCLAIIALLLTVKRGFIDVRAKELPLPLLITILFVPIFVAVFLRRDTPTLANEAASILLAISTGILALVVSNSPTALISALSLIIYIQTGFTLFYQRSQQFLFQSGDVLRASGTFDHPNHLYTLMLVAVPLGIGAALASRSALIRFLFMVCAAGALSALTLTWFRGGMLGLTVALTYFAWKTVRSRRVALLAAVCGLALVAVVSLHRTAGTVNTGSVARSNAGRLLLWQKGEEVFLWQPLTGVGVGNLQIPTTTTTKDVGVMVSEMQVEPKNLFLFYLCEMGIGGGVLFALFVWTITAILCKASSPLAAGVGGAWLGLLTAGLVDTPFGPADRFVGNCCFGLLLGLTLLLTRKETTQ